jgi:integrative and conjugative element protein (TIGR02256 family)
MLLSLPFGFSDALLLIEPQVLQRLVTFRQMEPSAPEAGGILLGYRRGHHTHVSDATVPTKRDVQRRFAFFRHADDHQRVATRRWKQSGETMDYVGEWHTHPEDDPSPSGVDLQHWREIASAASRPMVFLIVGRQSNWHGAGWKQRIEELSIATPGG